MSFGSAAVVATLSLWFLLTALVQLPFTRCKRLRRFDPVGHLLPGWNFFAPKPIRADFVVWYRCWRRRDYERREVPLRGSGPWRELTDIARRCAADALVSRNRFARKSMFACCDRIMIEMRKHESTRKKRNGGKGAMTLPPDAVLIGVPYLLLAEAVSCLCADASAVQFRIDVVRYDGQEARSSTVFRSAVHWANPQHDRAEAPGGNRVCSFA
jgi:hypothetical protein